MKRHSHTPEQIVRKLREGEQLLNAGQDIAEVLRHLEVRVDVGSVAFPVRCATAMVSPITRERGRCWSWPTGRG